MNIRILINGASGKMGQTSVKAIQSDPVLELVAMAGRNDDLSSLLQQTKPDVAIDFTSPTQVYLNTKTIIEANVRPVIGTTGLTASQITELQNLCAQKKLGGLIAPNFSMGALLLMRFAREAARFFPHVEIVEMHHAAKEDSPSGTAVRTAEMIAQNRQEIPSLKPPREILPGARGAESHAIPIHALRLPGIVARQDVIFGGSGETLTLSHQSIDREAYMPGLRLACQKVMTLTQLAYGLETILD